MIIFFSTIPLLYLGICLFIYFRQDKLLFYPETLPQDFKFDFHGTYEEHFFKTEGAIINALHFKVPNPKGVILFLHGNAGSLRSWGLEGEEFNQMGYDCLIYDYRKFGKSKGPMHEDGFHKDVQYLFDFLQAQYEAKDIIIVGSSIGSGFAARLASVKNARALILITPYYSLKELASHYFSWLPVSLILKYNLKTHIWLKKVKSPVYIIHGTNDEVIPFGHALKLSHLLKPPDRFISVEGAGHNDISLYREYKKAIEDILKVR